MGRKKDRNVSNVLYDYRASLLIIAVNVCFFFYLKKYPVSPEVINSFVLSKTNLYKGNLFCFITAGFIHADLAHLLFNMFGIFIFGGVVERQFGFLKTLFIYLGALFISLFLSFVVYTFILHRNVSIIGSSGAVMGLISCAMLMSPFLITFEMVMPIPVMIKAWIFIFADLKGFLGGKNDGISHLAHLFGFLSIALLVYFFNQKERKAMRRGLAINAITFVVFLMLNQWMLSKTGTSFTASLKGLIPSF